MESAQGTARGVQRADDSYFCKPAFSRRGGGIITGFERYLLVGHGGAPRSDTRHALGSALASGRDTDFPWGTFAINITGSLVLGFFLSLAVDRLPIDPRLRLFMAVGFCGGYTTFSTFTCETAALLDAGRVAFAAANITGS